MLIFDPKLFVSKDDETEEVLARMQIDRMEFYMKHVLHARINFTDKERKEISDIIQEEIGIIIPSACIMAIFNLYLLQKIDLISNGLRDTGSSESIHFVVANFFGATRWPIYGDNLTKEEMKIFIARLKSRAKLIGFEVIE